MALFIKLEENTGVREIICALKEISKESMNVNEENQEEIRNEIEVLKVLIIQM